MRAKLWLVPLAAMAVTAVAQIAVQEPGLRPVQRRADQLPLRRIHDPVAQLQKRLDAGEAKLVHDGEPRTATSSRCSTLLDIPVSSQTLVFSKTSFQYPKISPQTSARALFQRRRLRRRVHDGKAIEIVSFDAQQGAIFYLLDEQKAEQARVSSAPSSTARSATSPPAHAACPAC